LGGQYTRDLKETGFEILGSIHVAQDRYQWWTLVHMVMIPFRSVKGGDFLTE